MKIVVIGGTGHIGTFLVPRLIESSHDVTVISRNQRDPYQKHYAWKHVKLLNLDRVKLEQDGMFGRAIADLSPEVIIDLVCFKPDSARQLVEALQGNIDHYLHCGTMWVHGHKIEVPSHEWHPRRPIIDYGIKKAATEHYLLHDIDQSLFPVTILHPGHIVGPGWIPVNPVGNFDQAIFTQLATGQQVMFPSLGMETLHHVHAADVAAAFTQAIANKEKAVGESFHILSENAITLRGYAETVARWHNQQADLNFVGWEQFRLSVSEEHGIATWNHLIHSSIGSIEKARMMLNYEPRYTSLDAIKESLAWLM